MLLAARALQGFASAAISICGTSIIAQMYPEEKLRSQIIGILLGSMALGVLFGYTFGGIFYAFCGKSTPFVIIAVSTLFILSKKNALIHKTWPYSGAQTRCRHSPLSLVFSNFPVFPRSSVLQLCCMDLQRSKTESAAINTNCSEFLSDPVIVKIVIAIFVSTIAMATLEPCLPIWLMGATKPEVVSLLTIDCQRNCSELKRFFPFRNGNLASCSCRTPWDTLWARTFLLCSRIASAPCIWRLCHCLLLASRAFGWVLAINRTGSAFENCAFTIIFRFDLIPFYTLMAFKCVSFLDFFSCIFALISLACRLDTLFKHNIVVDSAAICARHGHRIDRRGIGAVASHNRRLEIRVRRRNYVDNQQQFVVWRRLCATANKVCVFPSSIHAE